MTAVMSLQTQRQTDLFGAFLAAFEVIKSGMGQLAEAYKACVDAGIDMAPATLEPHGVPPRVTTILARISTGKLLPDIGYRLLAAPIATVDAIAALPRDTQAKVASEGVTVFRDNASHLVPIEDVMEYEARRLVDKTSGRLLPPEEQASRKMPRPKREDQRVDLVLTREQYNDLQHHAHNAGQSVAGYILVQLVKAGVLQKPNRSKSA